MVEPLTDGAGRLLAGRAVTSVGLLVGLSSLVAQKILRTCRTFGSLPNTKVASRADRRILAPVNFVGWRGGRHLLGQPFLCCEGWFFAARAGRAFSRLRVQSCNTGQQAFEHNSAIKSTLPSNQKGPIRP